MFDDSLNQEIQSRLLIGLLFFGGFLAAVVGASSAQAQRIDLGLHAGGTFASFRGETSTLTDIEDFAPESSANLGRRTAVQAGGFVQVGISDWFAVQPEINYVQKGTTLDATLKARNLQTGDVTTIGEIDLTAQLSYLEIPVLAKLQIPTNGPFTPSLFAGPSLGFTLHSKSEIHLRSESDLLEDETRTEDIDTQGTEFGAVLGGEIAYVFSSGDAASLNVRYSAGINDVSPDDAEASVQNEVLSIGVGYTLSL